MCDAETTMSEKPSSRITGSSSNWGLVLNSNPISAHFFLSSSLKGSTATFGDYLSANSAQRIKNILVV